MQAVKIIIAIIVFVALQGAASLLSTWFERVDLPLILTVYLALKRKPLQGTLVGTGVGLSYDMVSGVKLIGAGGFTKTLVGFILSSLNVHFAIDRKLMRLFVLVLASIANILIFLGLHSIFNVLPSKFTPPEIAKLTAWQAGGNLILGFFIFPFLDRIFVEQPYASGRGKPHW